VGSSFFERVRGARGVRTRQVPLRGDASQPPTMNSHALARSIPPPALDVEIPAAART